MRSSEASLRVLLSPAVSMKYRVIAGILCRPLPAIERFDATARFARADRGASIRHILAALRGVRLRKFAWCAGEVILGHMQIAVSGSTYDRPFLAATQFTRIPVTLDRCDCLNSAQQVHHSF